MSLTWRRRIARGVGIVQGGLLVGSMCLIALAILRPFTLCVTTCKIIKSIDRDGLNAVVAAAGILGTLLSWLLQNIRQKDYGVELGVIYHCYYPCYPWVAACFFLSSGICLYYVNARVPFFLVFKCFMIIVLNLCSMAIGLVWMIAMCISFLFDQEKRTRYVLGYLEDEIIKSCGSSFEMGWNVPCVERMVTAFPDVLDRADHDPIQWFFSGWLSGKIASTDKTGKKENQKKRDWEKETVAILKQIQRLTGDNFDRIMSHIVLSIMRDTDQFESNEQIANAYIFLLSVWVCIDAEGLYGAEDKVQRYRNVGAVFARLDAITMYIRPIALHILEEEEEKFTSALALVAKTFRETMACICHGDKTLRVDADVLLSEFAIASNTVAQGKPLVKEVVIGEYVQQAVGVYRTGYYRMSENGTEASKDETDSGKDASVTGKTDDDESRTSSEAFAEMNVKKVEEISLSAGKDEREEGGE